ncbi:hypothetical protein ACFSRY_05360 [Pontibacter locisalis]|uniref:Uncharacterized protein n=1 Tax=Pontibacter locisalis TaxID=1719035 RepID=A0ABW5IIT8_9BACT
MNVTGIQVFKKLNILLAVLLCSLFAFAIPVTTKAATDATHQESIHLAAESPLVLFAGEVSSGEPEAVLLLNKSLLTPILSAILVRLYPENANIAPAPHSFPASKGDCGLHTILTKGP